MWKKTNEAERAPFVKKAEKLKAKYESAKAKYLKTSGYAKFQEELKAWKAKAAKKPFPKDSNAPKRPMSSYMFFVNEQRPYVVSEHPDMKVTDVLRELGKRWSRLSSKQQAPYVVMQKEAKEEYMEELAKYQSTAKFKKYQKEKAEYQAKQKEAKRKASGGSTKQAKKAKKPKRRSVSRSRSSSRRRARRRASTPKAPSRRSASSSRSTKRRSRS